MDLVSRINNTSFLGREFLTWMWFRAEGNEGIFKLGERYVEVYFDDKLTLEALGDIKETNVIKSEAPTETEEARASLQSGKHVAEARLRVVAEQKQWAVTLKADDLAMGSLKIPGILSKEEAQSADVLNGIAYDADSDRIYITGKWWPKLFEVTFQPKPI